MEPTTLREQLARDIFVADNSNAPEQQMIQEWASAVNDDKARLHGYAYNIADGLIAKGYRL